MSRIGETDGPAPSNPPRKKKRITESKRLRDVFRYCPKELRGFDLSSLLESSPNTAVPPPDFVPSPSPDPALTAFAQLGALRLGAARALISLLDGHNQYILAEATSSLPLRSKRRQDAGSELWLGNVRIPRSSGVCERVLGLNTLGAKKAVVIDDMAENEQLCTRSYVKEGPKWRFYAGVPMRSPDGAVIGALCIFDDKTRDGLSGEDLEILHDLADTVVEHLATYTLREENRRGERMVRGLTSFLAGASSLQQTSNSLVEVAVAISHGLEKPVLRRSETEDSIEPVISKPIKQAEDDPPITSKAIRPEGQAREKSASSMLQDSILPPNSRTMFSRAANIIRETSELDGVVIFDASIAGVGGHRERSSSLPRKATADDPPHSALTEFRNQNEHSSNYHDTSSDSSNTSLRKDRQRCQILGFSCAGSSSVAGDSAGAALESLTEHDLKKLLKSYNSGKIMNFGTTGVMTSSDESTKEDDDADVIQKQPKRKESTKRLMDVIKHVAPGVRSLCFLPLWDYERSRWFVGCLFWTTQKDRLLSPALDLVYLKAFGNSVMTELSRLNAIASNKTKTTFAASISHELRSPLHGILGGIEFLQQSDNLDPFQKSMLHSTAICGKTLLDTLNHVMDYAKINEINGGAKSRTQILKSNSVRVTSRPMRNKRAKEVSNLSTPFDLSVVTEEVIEAVFASQSYRVAHDRIDEDHSVKVMAMGTNSLSPESPGVGNDASRKLVLIILDISAMDKWMFSMPVGAWRRILMNLFGNALKYTDSGSIQVSLEQAKQETSPHTGSETKVVLTVKDTGIGMSPDFLANHLYSPFTQENHLSSGVGLGLNIVRQILESVSGSIDFTSDLGSGTEVSVTLSLPGAASTHNGGQEVEPNFDTVTKRLNGHKIALVDRAVMASKTSTETGQQANFSLLATTLASTIRGWFKKEVLVTGDTLNLGEPDIIICTEPSFEFLASTRQLRPVGGKVPVIIFLAMDAIEAAALRTDVRVTSKESVVEVVPQPCGPYKLARVLEHCITRFESPLENIAPTRTESSSPSVSPPSQRQSDPLAVSILIREHPSQLVDVPNGNSATAKKEDEMRLGLNVLIVDDNAINRRLLVALMKKHRFQYREAVNGLEAVQLYQTTSPRFDVVLMDLSMPIMDGMTASSKIRKYEREQRVDRTIIIALTGLVSASAKLEALESGIDSYLTKPVNFGKLIELLPTVEKERKA